MSICFANHCKERGIIFSFGSREKQRLSMAFLVCKLILCFVFCVMDRDGLSQDRKLDSAVP